MSASATDADHREEPAEAPAPAAARSAAVGQEWLKLSASDVLGTAWDALRSVYDPELYLDVVSLGLVYDVREEDGAVVVEMTMTTQGCPASEVLPEMARDAIADATSGCVPVDVRVVWDPPWNPAMIDTDAAGTLGFRTR